MDRSSKSAVRVLCVGLDLFLLEAFYCFIVKNLTHRGGLHKQSLIKGNEQTASELNYSQHAEMKAMWDVKIYPESMPHAFLLIVLVPYISLIFAGRVLIGT